MDVELYAPGHPVGINRTHSVAYLQPLSRIFQLLQDADRASREAGE